MGGEINHNSKTLKLHQPVQLILENEGIHLFIHLSLHLHICSFCYLLALLPLINTINIAVPTFEPAREAQKVNLDGLRKLKMPDRDLELPMSPIGHPSTLDFLDASTSSISLYEDQPKVSTQKLPRHTILDSFGPPNGRKKKRHNYQVLSESAESLKETLNSSLSTSCLTESVFPAHKKPPTHQPNSWSQWTEQNKRKHQSQARIERMVTSKGARNICDKSYDHEVREKIFEGKWCNGSKEVL